MFCIHSAAVTLLQYSVIYDPSGGPGGTEQMTNVLQMYKLSYTLVCDPISQSTTQSGRALPELNPRSTLKLPLSAWQPCTQDSSHMS